VSLASQVSAEIAALHNLNMDGLRKAWRERYGAPPYLRSPEVFRRLLAERIQLEAFGGDEEVDARLAVLVRNYERSGVVRGPAPPARAGTILIREYEGRTHRVEVREKDFVWEGQAFRSLSQIARQITGTRWNGPAFFGLRGAVKGRAA